MQITILLLIIVIKEGEAKMSQGFIMLHRSIQNHWIYDEKRKFSNYEAWLDLLMMVNHKDNKILQDGKLVEVKRGERITSIRQLMERWGWSNTKVKNYLELLQSDNMIVYEVTAKKKTLIKIVKYEQYQGVRASEQSEETTQNTHKKDTETTENTHRNDTEATQNNINNNDNNANNDKNENNEKKVAYADFVKLFPSEYDALVEKLGEGTACDYIERLDNYIGSKGKKYKSHYRTILTWVNKDNKAAPKQNGGNENERPKNKYAGLF